MNIVWRRPAEVGACLGGGGLRVARALLDVLATDLGVGLAAGGLVHVNGDVVVGVGTGLGAGRQLLAGELLERGLVGGGEVGEPGLGGRHGDVLCRELVGSPRC